MENNTNIQSKPRMFKDYLSFKGRIRRLEYGLSIIIANVYTLLAQMIIFVFVGDSIMGYTGIILLAIPLFWFMFSQGARCCHDLEHSGWWQLIPFYILIMLFKEGVSGENKYGDNPKGNS